MDQRPKGSQPKREPRNAGAAQTSNVCELRRPCLAAHSWGRGVPHMIKDISRRYLKMCRQ